MSRQSATNRRGTVLIAVLVCMGFATSILLGVVQTSLRLRREVRRDLQMEQTKWLMDLGVVKAISGMQSQPGYDGETLAISTALAKYGDASIDIKVIREDQPTDRVRLRVTARLSGSGGTPSSTTQRSTEVIVSLPDKPTKIP
jgi:type II secretory pathway component PulK